MSRGLSHELREVMKRQSLWSRMLFKVAADVASRSETDVVEENALWNRVMDELAREATDPRDRSGHLDAKETIEATRKRLAVDDERRRRVWGVLREAEPFYVSPEICRLISSLAASLPATTFDEHMIPTTYGFVWLGTPLVEPPFDELDDGERVIEAFSWQPTLSEDLCDGERGLSIVGYGDTRAGSLSQRLSVTHRQYLVFGKTIRGEQERLARERAALGSLPALDVSDRAKRLRATLGRQEPGDRARDFVSTFFVLINQRLLARTRRPLKSDGRSASSRSSVSPGPDMLNIFTLRGFERRDYERPETHREIEWACRWLVRWHWRRSQPYGPGRSLRKTVLVPPHIKGPEDKPFRPRDRGFGVVR